VRIHLLQVRCDDTEPSDVRLARVVELVRAQRGADLLVLPELWVPGGFAHDSWAELAEPLDGPVLSQLAAAARDVGAVVHIGSVVERARPGEGRRHGRYNTSVVLDRDGTALAVYRKIHRFGFGAGEQVLLDGGDRLVTFRMPVATPGPEPAERQVAGRSPDPGPAPVVGLAICYDLRFPELFRLLLDAGAELFCVPAAWPASRIGHWSLLGRARAVENQCLVLACNAVGVSSGVRLGGHSQVVAPTGEVLAEAGDTEEVLTVEVDPAETARCRAAFPVLADRWIEVPGGSRAVIGPAD
jgi:predicted amidohydrolase